MKIFRPVLQIYKKILMAFSRKQRNANPVIVKQKAAINRRKPGYSGFFGTPEGIRTPDTRLRRAVLCPAELLARMQFLFVSVTPAVENPPDVRRRPLYPIEPLVHEPKRWTSQVEWRGFAYTRAQPRYVLFYRKGASLSMSQVCPAKTPHSARYLWRIPVALSEVVRYNMRLRFRLFYYFI